MSEIGLSSRASRCGFPAFPANFASPRCPNGMFSYSCSSGGSCRDLPGSGNPAGSPSCADAASPQLPCRAAEASRCSGRRAGQVWHNVGTGGAKAAGFVPRVMPFSFKRKLRWERGDANERKPEKAAPLPSVLPTTGPTRQRCCRRGPGQGSSDAATCWFCCCSNR